MTVNILANLTTQSPLIATGTWAEMTGLSATNLTVAGTDSVLLIIASMAQLGETDRTAEHRLSINGSPTGSPVLTSFSDASNEAGNTTLAFAVNGLSGSSNDIAVEWQSVSGSPARDVGRVSSLMILEITGGDAILQANLSSTAAANPGATWSDLFATGNIDVDSTASIMLLIADVQITGANDAAIDFRFSVDGTLEGALTSCYTDATDEMTGWSGIHVVTGLSAGNHTFELQYQDRYQSPTIDTTRLRTFQVVELKVGTLETSLISAFPYAATIGWNDDPTLDDAVVVDGTDSILLHIANVTHADGADRTAGFRLYVNGTQRGADLIDFSDNTDRVGRTLLGAAITGLSGSHNFSLQWEEVAGVVSADTLRWRSMFVIQFTPGAAATVGTTLRAYLEAITYDIEGIVYDVDGDPYLGAASLFLFKDNGDNTLTFVDHTVSSIGDGSYSFTVDDDDAAYLVTGFSDLATNIFDVTDHNLLPKETPTESYDLYLRSDVNKGETPVSTNLRLRTQADKEVEAVEISTTLRGHLSEHLTIATDLRAFLQGGATIATDLRAWLSTQVVVQTQLRSYLRKDDNEIVTSLRGHLSENVTVSTDLRAYLQASVEITTDLRAYLQALDVEIATTLRGYLGLSGEITTDLRAYLKATVEVSADLRAYLSRIQNEVSTTLSAYLLEFDRQPHHCFKASPRESFTASERESFTASGRESFGSSPDSCPFKED